MWQWQSFCKSFVESTLWDYNFLLINRRLRHLQSQEQVERFNQTCIHRHAKMLDASETKELVWLSKLDKITFGYKTAVHSATWKSPFQLLSGQKGFNNNISQIGQEMNVDNNVSLDFKMDDEISSIIEPNGENDERSYDKTKYLERMDLKTIHPFSMTLNKESLLKWDKLLMLMTKQKKENFFVSLQKNALMMNFWHTIESKYLLMVYYR